MVLLRKYRMEDVDSIARHAGNEKVARWMRDSFPHPYTRQDAETFIASCIAREGQGQLVRTIEVDGAAVGSIGVFVGGDVYCKSGELGYWLGEAYWGRGIMTQAVRQICEEAFRRFQGTPPPAAYWKRLALRWRELCAGACIKTDRSRIPACMPC